MHWHETAFPDGEGTVLDGRFPLDAHNLRIEPVTAHDATLAFGAIGTRTFLDVHQCMAACEGSQLGLLWEIETSGVYITYIPFAWFSDGHGGGVAATAGNRYDKEAS